MNCNQVRESLSLYMDHYLNEKEMLEVEKHLLTCDACKIELESLTLISGLLKDLPEVVLPREFDSRLKEKLLQTNNQVKSRKWMRYSSIAAIFLVGIFTVAMYNDLSGSFIKNPENSSPALTMMKTISEPGIVIEDQPANESQTMKSVGIEAPNEADVLSLADTAALAEVSQVIHITPAAVTQEPVKLFKEMPLDEEMIVYVGLLDELYTNESYQLINWTLESDQVYVITIELEKVDESGNLSYDLLSYTGQDGKLCKTESL